MDRDIAAAMNALHAAQQGWLNARRREGRLYQVGDKVWVARPKQIGGHKIQPWWAGPFPIVEREGDQSYVVQWGPEGTLRVHADQLKPWVGDPVTTPGVPLVYNSRDDCDEIPAKVSLIRAHRETRWGFEFLVHWVGAPASEDSWEPLSTFLRVKCPIWQLYCQHHSLPIVLPPPAASGGEAVA